MASVPQYAPEVKTELCNAWESARAHSNARDAIAHAVGLVCDSHPIMIVKMAIVEAMSLSTHPNVLYSLSEAYSWIGPTA